MITDGQLDRIKTRNHEMLIYYKDVAKLIAEINSLREETKLNKFESLCKSLADYFKWRPVGPCACNGPGCREVGCSHFWELVVGHPDILKEALDRWLRDKDFS